MAVKISSVDIVIVNWNTGNRLRECLASLTTAERHGFILNRVMVVDNASSDDSAKDLQYPELPLTVIHNHRNRGFAAACNQAALDAHSDYLLFLNPDTRVLPDTLAKSTAWMDDPEHSTVGILGVMLLDDSGQVWRRCAPFLRTRNFLWKMLGLSRLSPKTFPEMFYLDWNHLDSRPVDQIMGAYFMIRNSVFTQAHGFDERFFLYFEDADLSLRARQSGCSSYYLASAQCYHSGCVSSDQIKATRLFYVLRSRIYYAFKHFSKSSAVTLLLATLSIEPASRILLALLKGSGSEALETIRGYLQLWHDLPKILRTAKTVQANHSEARNETSLAADLPPNEVRR